MMAWIIWCNIVIGLMLFYCFIKLKSLESKTLSIRVQLLLVVVAMAGIFLTFGENLIYLLTSGILAFVVAEKDYKKGNARNIKMDN